MKIARSFLLSAALISGVAFHAPSSQAYVSIVVAPPAIAIIGIVGSSVLIAQGFNDGFTSWYGWAGLIIADKNTNEVSMKPVSEAQAKKLGLTKAELEAYDQELETINLALSEMTSTVSQGELTQEVQEKALAQFKLEVSENAFNAVQKIAKASIPKK